jgi:alpha-1,3-rhamnosyl/mannosyltransferase
LKPVLGQDLALGLSTLGLKPGYFLHVGTLEPRKNLLMLARAWADLPPAIKHRHPLVLAGGWGWRCDELRQFIEDTPGIIRLGYVPESELAALYSGALALVFPSLYEGFGMPVIEMLACGGGVIASSIPALTEVLGPHAHFLAPHDAAGWRDAMQTAADNPEWLDLVRSGAQLHAAQFTWKATAQATRTGYARLLGINPKVASQAA